MREESKRLKAIRKSLSLTQAVFAEGLGLKQGPYSMIESGKVGLSSEVLRKLIKHYQVNPLFLFQGQGPMTITQAVQSDAEVAEAVKVPPIPKALQSDRGEGITLARLAELRQQIPVADVMQKDQIIEELITACWQLKDENSKQKDKIIQLMQKIQGLLGAMNN